MKVQNYVEDSNAAPEIKTAADKIQKIFENINSPPAYHDFPLICVEEYVMNKEGKVEGTIYFGMVQTPVTLSERTDKGINSIGIKMGRLGYSFCSSTGAEGKNIHKPINIPSIATILAAEEVTFQGLCKEIAEIKNAKDENGNFLPVVCIYAGDSAYENVTELKSKMLNLTEQNYSSLNRD